MAINEKHASDLNDKQSESEEASQSGTIPKPEGPAPKETTPENRKTEVDEFEIQRKSFFGW
jgi:hypothetical protein